MTDNSYMAIPVSEFEDLHNRLAKLVGAAKDLYERVEMDESVGICLSDRVPSLRLGQVLAEYEKQ